MRRSSALMSLAMLVIFVAMAALALTYPPGARFQPLVIGLPAIALCLLQLVLDLRAKAPADPEAESVAPGSTREPVIWGYIAGLVTGILLLGFWIAIPCFLAVFLHREAGIGLRLAAGSAAAATTILYAVFAVALRTSLHEGFLWQAFR